MATTDLPVPRAPGRVRGGLPLAIKIVATVLGIWLGLGAPSTSPVAPALPAPPAATSVSVPGP